jgi:hypothetical protein
VAAVARKNDAKATSRMLDAAVTALEIHSAGFVFAVLR